MELKGIEYLRNKLSKKRKRVLLRYEHYDMKNDMEYFSKLIPKEYRWLSETLGWNSKAVDSIADRLVFKGFKNDTYNISRVYEMNNADVLFDDAILSSLISSCSFIYITPNDDMVEGYDDDPDLRIPKLQVIDGANATGIIDPTTHMLQEGYAVLLRDTSDNVLLEAYFEPGKTTYYPKGGTPYSVVNCAPYPLLVPIIYRPDARRPFGHSRISRACMGIVQSALRTILRNEVAGEFYSMPQKYVLGLGEDSEFNGKLATMSTFLSFGKDEDGDKPQVGQFQSASIAPFVDQMRMFASLFAGETGLTTDDLGFSGVNPSNAESIRASHVTLQATAKKAQRSFGSGFLNAGFLAVCLRDNRTYRRNALYDTKPTWNPVFGMDASGLAALGDAYLKLSQSGKSQDEIDEMLGL